MTKSCLCFFVVANDLSRGHVPLLLLFQGDTVNTSQFQILSLPKQHVVFRWEDVPLTLRSAGSCIVSVHLREGMNSINDQINQAT